MAVDAQLWATRAGDHAFDQLAPIEAAEHYRVALEMATSLDRPGAERADLLVRLGDAQHRAGDPRALETLELGADLARRNGADGSVIRAAFAADRGFMRIDSDAADLPGHRRGRGRGRRPVRHRDLRPVAGPPRPEPRVHPGGGTPLQPRSAGARSRDRAPTTRRSSRASRLRCSTRCGHRAAGRSAPASRRPRSPRRRRPETRRLEFAAHAAAYDVAIEAADHVAAARSLAALRAVARDRGEPRMRWTAALFETFDATMAGRLEAAEALANHALELGVQIGDPDAFTFFAGQYFVIGTFAGRHDELFPLVEQAARDNPGILPFEIAYAIISAAVGRHRDGPGLPGPGDGERVRADSPSTTCGRHRSSGTRCSRIELEDPAAAAQLLPIITPLEGTVSFNGVTSQGPISAYVGKLASLRRRARPRGGPPPRRARDGDDLRLALSPRHHPHRARAGAASAARRSRRGRSDVARRGR